MEIKQEPFLLKVLTGVANSKSKQKLSSILKRLPYHLRKIALYRETNDGNSLVIIDVTSGITTVTHIYLDKIKDLIISARFLDDEVNVFRILLKNNKPLPDIILKDDNDFIAFLKDYHSFSIRVTSSIKDLLDKNEFTLLTKLLVE